MNSEPRQARGINLIDLAVVVVIIAVIGAIAIPKMSRGEPGAADGALIQDLSTLRNAIDRYNFDHPTAPLNNINSAAELMNALTLYSDSKGNVGKSKTATIVYGPYLHSVPSLPIGTNKNSSTITVSGPLGSGGYAWYFNGTTFLCNDPSTDIDASGNPYNGY
jgi:type II secretory pathway pseudopilin PulG